MPEELAIALAVLAATGWIIYQLVKGVTKATRTAHAEFSQNIRNMLDGRYRKKRARIAPHVRVVLPQELELAAARLKEAEFNFAQQRSTSVWTPGRPTWKRIQFQPYVFADQSPAARTFNIAEIGDILSPNIRPWNEQESELLRVQCFYPERLSLVERRAIQECLLPPLSLAPAVFAFDDGSVRERAILKFFGKERADVMTYNSLREELVSRHKALVTEIGAWNLEEHTRFTQYCSE